MERLASNDNVTLSLATSARLLSFEDIGSAWSQELKNRVNSTDMVRPAQSKSGSPVFETTGEVYTSREIIGGGNTTKVFKVTDSEGRIWAVLSSLKQNLR